MVREVSSSIWAQAASEIGASSRCRLFIGIFSFQGTYAERTILGWRVRSGGLTRRRGHRGPRCARGCSRRGLFSRDIIEERDGRNEEQTSRDRGAEVENAVVITGRTADEHVFEHLFNGAGRAAVANEVGAELAVAGAAEGHVVAQDLDFLSVFFDDREGVVRRTGLDRVVEFDIRDLFSPDDFFLGFGGDLVPGV